MRLALDHQHIRATGLRQMISHTRSDNAAADDDDVRRFTHSKKVSRKGAKIAKKKGEQLRSPFAWQTLEPSLTVGLLSRCYAGAGVPPVIGGRIGFSGFAAGSLILGCSSELTVDGSSVSSTSGKPATMRRI